MRNINVDITLLGYKHLVKNTYNYTMYKNVRLADLLNQKS